MKELSIEEKAKRYDEALEKTRRCQTDKYGCLLGVKPCDLFSELAESEDEMIRKEILQSIKDNMVVVHKKECLAWLEKQGEQKPNYCHHEVDLSGCSEEYRKAYYDGWNNCNMQHSQCKSELDDVIKCLINGMKFYYEDNEEATWGTDKWSMPVKHIIEVLKRQDEQKSAEVRTTGYWNVQNIEQKPTWSEDDKEQLDRAIYMMEQLDMTKSWDDVYKWLKSFKNRVLPQSKQEWSEEDERNIKELLYLVEANYLSSEEPHNRLINFLESISPKTTWKPSDEQIEALDNFIYAKYPNTEKYGDVIKLLYDDLKKL